jgi:hypothetical protein
MRGDNQKFTGGHGRFDAEPYLTAESKKRPRKQRFLSPKRRTVRAEAASAGSTSLVMFVSGT